MSCSDNKTTATTNFNAASYSASASNISLTEETESSNNACTLTSVRGKIRLDLTAFSAGTCTVYFKVAAQTDGSSNSPPVTANSTYIAALSATLGMVNLSGYYGNTTPTFSGSNDCGAASKVMGWAILDAVGAIRPTFTYNC